TAHGQSDDRRKGAQVHQKKYRVAVDLPHHVVAPGTLELRDQGRRGHRQADHECDQGEDYRKADGYGPQPVGTDEVAYPDAVDDVVESLQQISRKQGPRESDEMPRYAACREIVVCSVHCTLSRELVCRPGGGHKCTTRPPPLQSGTGAAEQLAGRDNSPHYSRSIPSSEKGFTYQRRISLKCFAR